MADLPPLIAVLDDEAGMRTALRRLLRTRGYEAALFEDGAALLAAQPERPFACILLDLHMPKLSGFDILAALAERATLAPVIVITGHDQPGNEERTFMLGAAAYLTKPVDAGQLIGAIESARQKASGPR